ncbi:MAG: hypothetical protein V1774_11450, partial [Candidatus Eisenbacteria bacterium]
VRLGAWVGLPHTIAVENGRLMDQPISTPDAMITYRSYWEIADYDLEVPLFATLGLAVGPIRGVEIAADYNLRPWSEVEIKHHDEAFRAYDGAYPAADVESFHMGGRFEFPLFRKPLHAAGLRLDTMIGFRALPLSMRETDLTLGADAAPHYQGDQISVDATSIGLTLETGQVSFHTGLEFQSFDYHTWFLNDERGVGTADQRERELWFSDPLDRMISVSHNNTVFRFTAELKL